MGVVGEAANQECLWVLQAREGHQEAFAQLVRAYQLPVYNLAYRMLGSSTEAEDATQETFLRAYTRLDSYDESRKFSSWILSIASHYCVDRLRRRHGGQLSLEQIRSWQWIPDSKPKPEDQLLVRERDSNIHSLLEELPPQYRLVIVLRYWYDLSYEEIAEMTDSTASAVKSRLHRARQMMAMRLNEEDAAQEAAERGKRKVAEHAMSGSY